MQARKLTREKLEKIFEETEGNWKGDNAIQGLLILMRYFNFKEQDLIVGADHDVIWSVNIDDALEKGLTEEDAILLATLNWSIYGDGDCFSCFC